MDKLKTLYTEMQERLAFLESNKNDYEDNIRIQELTLAIVRVQQLLLEEPKWDGIYRCSVCHQTPVDVENGIDTCDSCLNNI